MGVGPSERLWPLDRGTLSVYFLNGYDSDRQTVKDLVLKHYNSLPMGLCFQFSQTNIYSSDIRIEFASHSSSYIGRDAEGYPGQATMWLNMHPKMYSQEAARDKVQADVLHEFGHALGLVHEHKHPGCGATWDYGVLMGKNGWGMSTVRRNYDDNTRSALATNWEREYDPYSIMHYPVHRGDTVRGVTSIDENFVLSKGDKEALESLYPLAPVYSSVVNTKEPSIAISQIPGSSGSPMRISGNKSAVVNGGYVVVSGNASATVHGGGYVVVSGNASAVVHGDSSVKVSGNGSVRVNGSGTAEVSGNGTASFTGTGTGKARGNGTIRSNVY